MTITDGLNALTDAASTSPSRRPACADHRRDLRPALAEHPHDVAHPGLAEPRGERAAAGDRLEAAAIPAAAEHVVVVAHVDVADVARRALGAAHRPPVRDQPSADPGPDLDEHEVLGVRPRAGPLAERHQVRVVVDERRRAVPVREPRRDRIAVPAGHDRRRDRDPGRMLDRARQPEPDPQQRAARPRARPRAARRSGPRATPSPPRGRRRSRCRAPPRRRCRRPGRTARGARGWRRGRPRARRPRCG